MTKKFLFLIVLLFSMYISLPNQALAVEQPYTVKPLIDKSMQSGGITDYFSFSPTTDSLKTELSFLVENKTSEKLSIKVKKMNATTSPKGVIQYKESAQEDNSLLTDDSWGLAQYLETEESLVLNPNEKRTVKVSLSIPKLTGTILGAVGFQSTEEQDLDSDGGSQFKINNEMNTIIGVLVNYKPQEPKLAYDKPYISPMPSYFAIRLPVTFDSATLLKDTKLEYTVSDQNGKKLFGSGNASFSFAPKSKVGVSLRWDTNEIEKNVPYTLKGSYTYTYNGSEKVSPFEFTFTYTGKETPYDSIVDNVTGKPSVKEDKSNLPLVLFTFILGVILATFLFLLIRRTKKVYILHSDSETAPTVIDKTHPMFTTITESRTPSTTEKTKYLHTYSLKKKKGNIIYTWLSTKEQKHSE